MGALAPISSLFAVKSPENGCEGIKAKLDIKKQMPE
jgi:hypothetical protein